MKNKIQHVIDWILGFDCFISYAHADGTHYARGLANQLAQSGMHAFLDKTEYVAGDDLSIETRRRVKMSRSLIVVCTPQIFDSAWVHREVEIAIASERRIVVIDIKRAFEAAPVDHPLRKVLKDHIRILEPFDADVPSPDTAKQIEKSRDSMRQKTRRIITFGAAGAVIAVLVAGIAWLFQRGIDQGEEYARSQSMQALARGESAAGARDSLAAGAYFAQALRFDPTNDAAADRLHSFITHRPSQWRIARRTPLEHSSSSWLISPNGRSIAMEQTDGSIVVAYESTPLRKLLAALGPVASRDLESKPDAALAFSRDGRVLAAICADGVLRVWDASKGIMLVERKDLGSISAVAVSPAARFIAVGRAERSSLVIPLDGGVEFAEPVAFKPEMTTDIGFIDEETVLVTRTTRVDRWLPNKKKSAKVFSRSSLSDPDDETSHKYHGFRISPDGNWQAWIEHDYGDFQAVQFPLDHVLLDSAGKADQQASNWGWPRNFGDNISVDSVVFDSASAHLAIVTDSIYVARRDRAPIQIDRNSSWAGFDPTSTMLYAVENDSTSIWSLANGRPIGIPLPAVGRVGSISIIRSGDFLVAIVAGEKEITWWSLHDRATQATSSNGATLQDSASSFRWTPRSQRSRNGVGLSEKTPGEWEITVPATSDMAASMLRIAYTLSDETLRKLEERDSNERLRDEMRNETFNAESMFRAPELEALNPQTGAAISADGKTIVTIAGERAPAVWQTGRDLPIRSLGKDGARYAGMVALSENGRRALVWYGDSYAIFDVDRGVPLEDRSIDGALMDVSDDLSRLLVLREDSTLEVVDALTSARIGSRNERPRTSCSAALSPTGRQIATASTLGSLTVYDATDGVAVSEPLVWRENPETSGPFKCSSPWFDESGRYIFADTSDEADGKEPRHILRWKTDVTLTAAEALAFANFSEELLGSRISAEGTTETIKAVPADELMNKYLKPDLPGLGEIVESVLTFQGIF